MIQPTDRRVILAESLDALQKCTAQLRFSIDKCASFSPPFSAADLESIEALTSRFARTSDVLTHKASRSLLLFLREDAMSFLDTANFLEKIRVAQSADDVIQIRELRNEIAHEYSNRDSVEMLDACRTMSSILFAMIEELKMYIERILI